MMADTNYVNIEKILTPVELERARGVIVELVDFWKHVPIMGHDDKEVFDVTKLYVSGRLLLERIAILKRLCQVLTKGRNKKNISKIDYLWSIIIGDERSIVAADVIEPLGRNIAQLIGPGNEIHSFNSLFGQLKIQGSSNLTPRSILPVEGEIPDFDHIVKLIHYFRNKSAHGDRELPAATVWCTSVSVILFLAGRFSDVLEKKHLTNDDYVNITECPEEYRQQAEKYGTESATAYFRDKSIKAISQAFKGSILQSKPELYNKLPNMSLSRKIVGKRLLAIEGPRHSGKTIKLAGLIFTMLRYPLIIYVSSDDNPQYIGDGHDLYYQYIGQERLTMDAFTDFCNRTWLMGAINEGKVCVSVDTGTNITPNIQKLISELTYMPDSMRVIITTMPGANIPDTNGEFIHAAIMPFTQQTAASIMKLVSEQLNGIDLTHTLQQDLDRMAGNETYIYEPYILTTLVELLVRDKSPIHNYAIIAKRCVELTSHKDGLWDSQLAHIFNQKCERIKIYARHICDLMASGIHHSEIYNDIRRSEFMVDDNNRRELFEYCSIMRGEGAIDTLATLAAMSLVNTPADNDLEIAPHPGLYKLAKAVSAIMPDDTDKGAIYEQHDEVSFRPSPRYILERLVLNVMNLMRYQGCDYDQYQSQLLDMVKVAALSGAEAVLDELFDPWWLSRWLVTPAYKVPGYEKPGVTPPVIDNNGELLVVSHIVIDTCPNPVSMAIRLIKLMIEYGRIGCKIPLRGLLERLLTRNMNDRQRVGLLRVIRSVEESTWQGNKRMRDILNNAVILSMDIPTAHSLYITNCEYNTEIPIETIATHVTSHLTTVPLLLKLFEQSFYYSTEDNYCVKICDALVDAYIYTNQRYRDDFWNLIKQMDVDNPSRTKALTRTIRSIPFSSIRPDCYSLFYTPDVIDFIKWAIEYADNNDNKPYKATWLMAKREIDEEGKYYYKLPIPIPEIRGGYFSFDRFDIKFKVMLTDDKSLKIFNSILHLVQEDSFDKIYLRFYDKSGDPISIDIYNISLLFGEKILTSMPVDVIPYLASMFKRNSDLKIKSRQLFERHNKINLWVNPS